GPLKPALTVPNSAYNQFISVWAGGTGDLQRSFTQISEFSRLLQAAQPELDRLMVLQPSQPGPWTRGGVGRTPAESQSLTTLRSQTDELWQVYTSCVATHTAASVQRIKEHVKAIGELLRDTRLSQQVHTMLKNAKTEWGRFTSLYRNGD